MLRNQGKDEAHPSANIMQMVTGLIICNRIVRMVQLACTNSTYLLRITRLMRSVLFFFSRRQPDTIAKSRLRAAIANKRLEKSFRSETLEILLLRLYHTHPQTPCELQCMLYSLYRTVEGTKHQLLDSILMELAGIFQFV